MKRFYISILALCLGLISSLNVQAQTSMSRDGSDDAFTKSSKNFDSYLTEDIDTLWFEGFEDGVLPEDWDTIITNTKVPGGGNSLGIPAHFTVTDAYPVASEPFGVYHAGLWYDFAHQDEWLITKSFSCPSNAMFNFSSICVEGSTHGDHLYVKISTDDGSNWTTLWDALNLQPYDQNNYSRYYNIDLSDYANQEVRLAFNAKDTTNNGLYHSIFVDNISVTYTSPSSIDEAFASKYQVYPNPAQNFVKLSSEALIQQVNIITVNGQCVHSVKDIRNTDVKINTENLVDGLYFLEIVNDNGKVEKRKILIAR